MGMLTGRKKGTKGSAVLVAYDYIQRQRRVHKLIALDLYETLRALYKTGYQMGLKAQRRRGKKW